MNFPKSPVPFPNSRPTPNAPNVENKPDPAPTSGKCRRWCENGTMLDEECDVAWFQDPCEARDAGVTVKGPEQI